MHVIRFTVELSKFGTSGFANAGEYLAQRLDVNAVKNAPPILWSKDQMGVQQKDAMASRAVFSSGFWHNTYGQRNSLTHVIHGPLTTNTNYL